MWAWMSSLLLLRVQANGMTFCRACQYEHNGKNTRQACQVTWVDQVVNPLQAAHLQVVVAAVADVMMLLCLCMGKCAGDVKAIPKRTHAGLRHARACAHTNAPMHARMDAYAHTRTSTNTHTQVFTCTQGMLHPRHFAAR